MRRSEARLARATVAALLSALLILVKSNAISATDVVAPAAITDLTATPPSIAPQLHTTLTWTAPGDDGSNGTAASYDIRYRTDSPITEASWGTATQVTYGMTSTSALVRTEPPPHAAGSRESFTVVGLKPNTTYYWAIKTTDAAANTATISNSPTRTTAKYEGYGYQSVGGGGKAFCEVNDLSDAQTGSSNVGTLRYCLSLGDSHYIVFSVAGISILSGGRMDARLNNITIDGSTAPSPGITFSVGGNYCMNDGFIIGACSASACGGTGSRSHQIVTYLRFIGNDQWGDTTCTAASCCAGGSCKTDCGSCESCDDGFAIVGTASGTVGSHIVVDHVTIKSFGDAAADMSGHHSDVTYSYNFIVLSSHDQLISPSSSGHVAPARVSIHHNLYMRNGQRSPYISFAHTDYEFINNIVYDYAYDPLGNNRGYLAGGYGMQLQNEPTTPSSSERVDINIINNYFKDFQQLSGVASKANKALMYGTSPGWDSTEGGPSYSGCKKQGTVYTGSAMGQIWNAGNIFPAPNCDEYSTVSGARPVPVGAQVTSDAASALGSTVLPRVGTIFRTADEILLISAVALPGGAICGDGIRQAPESCDGSDLGGANCAAVSPNFTGGTLTCNLDCTFNTSLCVGNLPPGNVLNLRRSDTTSP